MNPRFKWIKWNSKSNTAVLQTNRRNSGHSSPLPTKSGHVIIPLPVVFKSVYRLCDSANGRGNRALARGGAGDGKESAGWSE